MDRPGDGAGAAECRRGLDPVSLLLFVLALGLVWGTWQTEAVARPGAPPEVVATHTMLACGHWPYLVVDADGVHLRGQGIALGSIFTAMAAALVLRWRRRRPRPV